MKILYLSRSDLGGGAAKGAYRLHKELINQGVDSTLRVVFKLSDDPTVVGLKSSTRNFLFQAKDLLAKKICSLQKDSAPKTINIFPSSLVKEINNSDADIVQMHWIGGEMLSIKDIAKINKPIVWRIADMWPFCGAEHYTTHYQRYLKGQTKKKRKSVKLDINEWTFKRKIKHWLDKPMYIVTSSNWLTNLVKNSYLLGNKTIRKIPNGLDLNTFQPISQKIARKLLGVSEEKKVICFGAMNTEKGDRKGFNYLRNALKGLNMSDKEILVFGTDFDEKINQISDNVKFLGRLNDEYSLSLVYNSADVVVGPSLQEAFGLVYIEAMACGTPCVAFDYSGPANIIDHKRNGYLAKYKDSKDLAKGIKYCIENKDRNKKLGENARKKALKEYDIKKQAKEYIKLYKEIIG